MFLFHVWSNLSNVVPHLNFFVIMDTTLWKRTKIITLREHTSKTISEIADKVVVSESTVKRILWLQREHGNVESKRKGKCGWNKLTTNKGDRKIVHASLKNPKLSVVDINRELKSECLDIDVSTVCRRLLSAGLKAYQPAKKTISN